MIKTVGIVKKQRQSIPILDALPFFEFYGVSKNFINRYPMFVGKIGGKN